MFNESDTVTAYPSDDHGPYSPPERMIAPRFRQIEALEIDNTSAILRARTLARRIDCWDPGSPRPLEIPMYSVDSAAVVWSLLADPEGVLPVTDRNGRAWVLHYAGVGLYARSFDETVALRDLVTEYAPLTTGTESMAGMIFDFTASDTLTTQAAAIQSALLRRGLAATVYVFDCEDYGSIGICEPQAGSMTEEWVALVNAALNEFTPPLRAEQQEEHNMLAIYEPR